MDITTLSIAQRFTKDYVQEQIKKLPQSGANDYTKLENKPKINGVELNGDLTSAELGLSDGSSEEWELIQDVTLEEDLTIVDFTDLNLKKAFIIIENKGTEKNSKTANGSIRVNDFEYFYSNNLILTDGLTRWTMSYVETCKDVKRHISSVNNDNTYQSASMTMGYFGDDTPIQKITIYAMQVYYLGKGSKIKLYGVRA